MLGLVSRTPLPRSRAVAGARAAAALRPQGAALRQGARGACPSLLAAAKVDTPAAKTKKKTRKEEEDSDGEEGEEEPKFEGPELNPTGGQIQALLNTLCDQDTVAQVEIQMGGFALKVRRNVAGAPPAPPPPPAYAPAPAAAAAAIRVVTAEEAPLASQSIDEALLYVTAPKVGVFRRGKYAGGKRVGKGEMVKEGDTVRANQGLGYIEQLGTFVEVKTPTGGEVAGFTVKDGDAVEYGQVLAELAPTFEVAYPAS